MQNPPPNPQQYPPPYGAPYSQPLPPNAPYSSSTQPIPPMRQAYPPYPPYPPYPHPQAQDNSTALVLEAVCSVFGLYGIGWLYRGRVGMGIALLALGFAWVAFALVVMFFTVGIAALCFAPLHVLFIVGDVLMLNNALRQPWQR